MAKTESRLAIGTAQFGLAYGLANRTGQLLHPTASAILACGWAAGIRFVDTAIAYGDSERRLGEIGVEGWSVVTKIPRLPDDCADIDGWINESIAGSLARLRIPRLYGVLLHHPHQLIEGNGGAIFGALLSAKRLGLVERIGVSIYDPEELCEIAARFQLDLVQAPFNLVDRRLLTSGWLMRLRSAGTEVHVRSVFLQGLLLMRDSERPPKFNRWSTLWAEWHEWLESHSCSALEACLGIVLS